jgi:hypothetical protein
MNFGDMLCGLFSSNNFFFEVEVTLQAVGW